MTGSALAPHRMDRTPAGLPPEAIVMAQAGTENFPVASRVLPRRVRGHLLALYGFARLVDDVGDEASGDRLALLDWLDAEVDRVYAGAPTLPVTARLAATVRACAIRSDPLRALIAANRQDQRITRYETIDDLFAYCELSANPVGRLVLAVLGAATPERVRLADAICTGLQLTEHWQDVVEDLDRGRVYVPLADLARFGCEVDDLRRRPAGAEVRSLLAFEVGRARSLLAAGAPLVRTLRGRPALAVAGFVAGGRAALDAIQRAGYDVSGGPPRPSRPMYVRALAATLAGTAR
ncbi:MAG: squalene synthase HpnC [Solirubrobacteraceae bacterium]